MEFALNWTLPDFYNGDIERIEIQVLAGRNGIPSMTVLRKITLGNVSILTISLHFSSPSM